MKKYYRSVLILFVSVLTSFHSIAQSTPQWTRDMNALPDTNAVTYPVRTLSTSVGDVIVLSVFYKQQSPTSSENKIYIRKYDYNGNVLWTYIFDNSGNNDTRAYDMALDNFDNVYVAGSIALTSMSGQPLLLKVSSAGAYVWMRNSVTAFSLGRFEKVIIRNNNVFVSSVNGIAQFNFSGTELWSHAYMVSAMTVDNVGQVIFSAYVSNPNTIFRLDVNGNINFSDSSLLAKRIATDSDNNFYLLSDVGSMYGLVKYDSAGIYQWGYNQFPQAPPFGDIGMELLVDYNNDLLVVGLSDTMYKFSPSGLVQWTKPMNGLDNYIISASIVGSNLLSVAGSVQGSGGYDISFSFFDLNGNPNWSGIYGGNVTQEFTKDMVVNGDGVYIIEDNNQNTTLIKFQMPTVSAIDYALICVDSVWYDPLNPQFINVSVFNGNVNHINYPSVQIVSPTGDTISNPSNLVNFFSHIGNTYQTYSDTITLQGITDFSNYTFLMSEGFGDTTVAINWCNVTSVPTLQPFNFSVYPNPSSRVLYMNLPEINEGYNFTVVNMLGEKIAYKKLPKEKVDVIDISQWANGMYMLMISDGKTMCRVKFLKQ